MPKPRPVHLVINQILRVIPSSETKLTDALVNYRDSLWNQSPESLYTSHNWIPLINILNNHIKVVNNDWKRQLIHIVNGTSQEKSVEQNEL